MNATVFDYSATLTRLGGDTELFADLVQFFLEDADQLLQRLHEAVELGDARNVELTAHSLKGLCSNFGARRAVEAAAATETTAQEGRLSPSDLGVDALDDAVCQLKQALTQCFAEQQKH